MSVKLGKHTPGSGLGYVWETADDVVEVDDEHVPQDLIKASHGDIYEIGVEEPEDDGTFHADPLGQTDSPAQHDTNLITEVVPGVNVVAAKVPSAKARRRNKDSEATEPVIETVTKETNTRQTPKIPAVEIHELSPADAKEASTEKEASDEEEDTTEAE